MLRFSIRVPLLAFLLPLAGCIIPDFGPGYVEFTFEHVTTEERQNIDHIVKEVVRDRCFPDQRAENIVLDQLPHCNKAGTHPPHITLQETGNLTWVILRNDGPLCGFGPSRANLSGFSDNLKERFTTRFGASRFKRNEQFHAPGSGTY